MKRATKLIFSLLLTAVFGWWAFRDTNWNEQWESLRSANYLWVIPYFFVLLSVHLCRTVRWGFLLSGMERIPFRKLNEASGIGFMMLIVLPFRLGEFARPFLINQRSSIRRSAAMTSVVLERIVDGMSVAVLMRVLLFFVSSETDAARFAHWGANLMFGIFSSGLAFLLFALWHRRRAVLLIRGILGRVSPRSADRVAEVVDNFIGAVRLMPKGWRLVAFFLSTALYWAAGGFGMWLLTQAFGCHGAPASAHCEPLQLTLFQAYVVMCVLVVGAMIPSAPGFVGTFQAAVKLGLSLFLPAALVNGKGVAYSNVLWFCQTFQQVGLGIILLSIGDLSFREITSKLEKSKLEKNESQGASPESAPPSSRSSEA